MCVCKIIGATGIACQYRQRMPCAAHRTKYQTAADDFTHECVDIAVDRTWRRICAAVADQTVCWTSPLETRGTWLVPEAGLEPARLAARDFLTTSAFTANAGIVRGLEHAFTVALQP